MGFVGKVAALATMVALGLSHPASAEELTKVTMVGSGSGMVHMSIFLAEELGFFKEQGIDFESVDIPGGATAAAAVLSGDAQIMNGSPTNVINAQEHGQDLTCFGSNFVQFANGYVIQGDVAKKLGLTDATPVEDRLKALKGLTIGVTAAGSNSDQLVRYLAKNVGLDPDKDMTIVPVGAANVMLAAFAQHRIDAFTVSSPTAETAVANNGAYMLLNLANGEFKPLDGYLLGCLVARQAWLKDNPKLAVGMLKAMSKAANLIRTDPEGTKAAIAKDYKGVDPAIFAAAYETNRYGFPASPRVTPESIEENYDFIEQSTGKRPTLDPAKVYTNDYVDQAGL
ncbi:MAG TPA: ABC transporter substrate-binding protein [Devosiaceae bacterium]|jgi:NitT/TauT family transport system substrate-binding protein